MDLLKLQAQAQDLAATSLEFLKSTYESNPDFWYTLSQILGWGIIIGIGLSTKRHRRLKKAFDAAWPQWHWQSRADAEEVGRENFVRNDSYGQEEGEGSWDSGDQYGWDGEFIAEIGNWSDGNIVEDQEKNIQGWINGELGSDDWNVGGERGYEQREMKRYRSDSAYASDTDTGKTESRKSRLNMRKPWNNGGGGGNGGGPDYGKFNRSGAAHDSWNGDGHSRRGLNRAMVSPSHGNDYHDSEHGDNSQLSISGIDNNSFARPHWTQISASEDTRGNDGWFRSGEGYNWSEQNGEKDGWNAPQEDNHGHDGWFSGQETHNRGDAPEDNNNWFNSDETYEWNDSAENSDGWNAPQQDNWFSSDEPYDWGNSSEDNNNPSSATEDKGNWFSSEEPYKWNDSTGENDNWNASPEDSSGNNSWFISDETYDWGEAGEENSTWDAPQQDNNENDKWFVSDEQYDWDNATGENNSWPSGEESSEWNNPTGEDNHWNFPQDDSTRNNDWPNGEESYEWNDSTVEDNNWNAHQEDSSGNDRWFINDEPYDWGYETGEYSNEDAPQEDNNENDYWFNNQGAYDGVDATQGSDNWNNIEESYDWNNTTEDANSWNTSQKDNSGNDSWFTSDEAYDWGEGSGENDSWDASQKDTSGNDNWFSSEESYDWGNSIEDNKNPSNTTEDNENWPSGEESYERNKCTGENDSWNAPQQNYSENNNWVNIQETHDGVEVTQVNDNWNYASEDNENWNSHHEPYNWDHANGENENWPSSEESYESNNFTGENGSWNASQEDNNGNNDCFNSQEYYDSGDAISSDELYKYDDATEDNKWGSATEDNANWNGSDEPYDLDDVIGENDNLNASQGEISSQERSFDNWKGIPYHEDEERISKSPAVSLSGPSMRNPPLVSPKGLAHIASTQTHAKSSPPVSRRVAASSVLATGKTRLPSPPLSSSSNIASPSVSPKVLSPSGSPPVPRNEVSEKSTPESGPTYDGLAPQKHFNPESYEYPGFFGRPVNNSIKTLGEELLELGEDVYSSDDEVPDFPGAKEALTQSRFSPGSVRSIKDRMVMSKQKPKASIWTPSDTSPFKQQALSPVAPPFVTPPRPTSVLYPTATQDAVNNLDNIQTYASAKAEANKGEHEDFATEISRNNFTYFVPTAPMPTPQYFTASHTRPKAKVSELTKAPIEVAEKGSSPAEYINATAKESGPILSAQNVSDPTEYVQKVATKEEEKHVFDDCGERLSDAAAYYALPKATKASSSPSSSITQSAPFSRFSYVAGRKVPVSTEIVFQDGKTIIQTRNSEYIYEQQMMSAVTPDMTRSWEDMGKDSTVEAKDYFSLVSVSPKQPHSPSSPAFSTRSAKETSKLQNNHKPEGIRKIAPIKSAKKIVIKKNKKLIYDDHGRQLTAAGAYYACQKTIIDSSPPRLPTNQETPYMQYSYVAGGKVPVLYGMASEQTGISNQSVTIENPNSGLKPEYLYEQQMMSELTPDENSSLNGTSNELTDYFSQNTVFQNAGSPLIENNS